MVRAIDAHPSPKPLSEGDQPMLPVATVRALLNPVFTAAEFTPTQWDSAEDKAKFANAPMKFIAHEFPRQSFTKSLYQRLSNTFGHIVHTNLEGFYGAFFERGLDKVVFLEQTLSWPQFGDPTWRRDRRALACPICRVYGANSGAFAERLKVFNPRQCNRASSPSHFPGGEMTRPVHRLTRLNCCRVLCYFFNTSRTDVAMRW
jgi:hypothetical protein